MNKSLVVIITMVMMFVSKIYSTPPSWDVNPNAYQFSENITSIVYVNDTLSYASDNILGAFVGGECRGVATPIQVGTRKMYFMIVYSNVSSGETILFKEYVSSSDDIANVEESEQFIANSINGDPLSPKEFHSYQTSYDRYPIFGGIQNQTVEIGSMFSTFDLDDYLTEFNGDEIVYSVSGNINFTISIATTNVATITYPNDYVGSEAVVFKAMDKNTVNHYYATDTVQFTVQETNYPPTISEIPSQVVRIGQSFDDIDLSMYLTEPNGDEIKWDFIFKEVEAQDTKPSWSVNATSYQYSMTLTGVVTSLAKKAEGSGHLLGAFYGDEIRGVANAVNVLGKWMYMMPIYSNTDGEEISFKFFDSVSKRILPIKEKLNFIANNVNGDPLNPYNLNAGNIVILIDENNIASVNKLEERFIGSEGVTFIATEVGTNEMYSDSVDVSFGVEYFPFSAYPNILDFGAVSQDTSKINYITINNYSDNALSVIGITSDNSDFEIVSSTELTLTAKSSKNINIKFSPSRGNERVANIVFYHSEASSPDTIVVKGFGLGKYRTFSHILNDFQQSGVKLSFKKGVLKSKPNIMTAVENVFLRAVPKSIYPKGRTFLGIERLDSLKNYAWINMKTGKDVSKGLKAEHNGQTYPLDYIRDFVKNTKKPLSKAITFDIKYNNPAMSEGVLFKLNLIASESGVTNKGLGELVLDTNAYLFGKNLNGKTLNEVSNYFDSVMTYWTKYEITTLEDYQEIGSFVTSVLKRINNGFYVGIDSTNYEIDTNGVVKSDTMIVGKKKNAYAITLLKGKSVTDVSILKQSVSKQNFTPLNGGIKNNIQPETFSLNQNYPNPFNPNTTISFSLVDMEFVSLKIYDILGREIKTLINNEEMESGTYEIDFDANNLNSGIYFYKLTTNNFSEMKKMILVK